MGKRDANKKDEEGRETEGLIYLFGPIDTAAAARVCEKIVEANVEGKLPHLQLIVASEGGSVDAGFAVVDMIEWSEIPVHTIGLGLVASTGLMIFMAGEHGRRAITPRTSILSHRYSSMAGGNHSDLVASRKHQDLTHCRIVNHYIQHSAAKTEEELDRTLLRDTDVWLSPDEAIRHGLADFVQADRRRPYPFVVTRDLARTMERETRP